MLYRSPLAKKYPYSDLFWSAFSRSRTEYGETLCISSYSVRMQENADQNNSEYGHFSRSASSWLYNKITVSLPNDSTSNLSYGNNLFKISHTYVYSDILGEFTLEIKDESK